MSQTEESALSRARNAYQAGNSETRQTLEKVFGRAALVSTKNWQEIQSFEAACEVEGIDPVKFVQELEEKGYTADEIAYKKLKFIIRVINGGWEPDYTNSNQQKWWPYFNVKSGFGFTYAFADYDSTGTALGSRLVLETEKQAIHMGTYFVSEYKTFLM